MSQTRKHNLYFLGQSESQCQTHLQCINRKINVCLQCVKLVEIAWSAIWGKVNDTIE